MRRATRLPSRLFWSVVILILTADLAVAQPRPGPPSPGPAVPQPPRPGNPGPQPGGPQPQPGRPSPGPQPGHPGHPGRPQPGGPNPQPQSPQAPSTPWTVRNPLAAPSRPGQNPGSVPAAPVYVPKANVSADWQRANDLIRSGKVDAAQQIIQEQLQKDRSLGGMLSAVSSFERANISTPDVRELRRQTLQLAQTQIREGANHPLPWVVTAKFALEDRNHQQFHAATQNLVERFPNSEYAPYFTGIRQIQDGDWKGAEQSLRLAQQRGMPEESIAELLKMAIDNQKWIWQYATITGYVIAGWLMGLAFLFVIGRLLSRWTVRSLERGVLDAASPAERRLRRAYRLVVNLAGLYYFLSLPVVVILAIALPLTLGYALLMMPYLNLGLVAVVLVLGVGGVITALSGVRAAFIRVQDQEFGQAVSEEESPQLWQLARAVADRVGTRCVDEIRVIPSAGISVIERGGFLRRVRDRGRRVLTLGLGILEGLKLDALRCILAHEYGHFQNRDTAGGDIALHVYLAMENFADAIVRRGKIRWWDVAIHFLRFYHYLFRKLTFGASRLQEVLADRVAVQCYGRSAFVEGLTQAIRRSLHFELTLAKAIRNPMRNAQPALAFYGPTSPPDLDEREQIELAFRTILERPTDSDDSHPSPKDRFQLAERFAAEDKPLSPEMAWSLLDGNDRILNEMRRLIDAVIDLEAGTVEAMLEYLSSILRQNPHPDVYFERARIYLSQEKYRNAIHDLNQAIHLLPDEVGILYLRALAYQNLNEYGQALKDLNAIVRHLRNKQLPDPEHYSLYVTLGECLLQIGPLEEAVQAFSKALERRPDSLVALVQRGRTHHQMGNHDLALKDFSTALAHWPNSPEPYLERAYVHEATGNLDQAERDRNTAKQLDPRIGEIASAIPTALSVPSDEDILDVIPVSEADGSLP